MIAPELTPFRAMQVQQALSERAAHLAAQRMTPGTFEADVVGTALRSTEAALVRVTEALYPVEVDLSRGDHFRHPEPVRMYEGMD